MKIKIMLVGLFFLALALTPLAAQDGPHAVPEGSGVIDAGNQICPVSGDKVNPEVTYQHGGKTYAFCCKGCINKFKKDPEKYLAETKVAEVSGGEEHAGHAH